MLAKRNIDKEFNAQKNSVKENCFIESKISHLSDFDDIFPRRKEFNVISFVFNQMHLCRIFEFVITRKSVILFNTNSKL